MKCSIIGSWLPFQMASAKCAATGVHFAWPKEGDGGGDSTGGPLCALCGFADQNSSKPNQSFGMIFRKLSNNYWMESKQTLHTWLANPYYGSIKHTMTLLPFLLPTPLHPLKFSKDGRTLESSMLIAAKTVEAPKREIAFEGLIWLIRRSHCFHFKQAGGKNLKKNNSHQVNIY